MCEDPADLHQEVADVRGNTLQCTGTVVQQYSGTAVQCTVVLVDQDVLIIAKCFITVHEGGRARRP